MLGRLNVFFLITSFGVVLDFFTVLILSHVFLVNTSLSLLIGISIASWWNFLIVGRVLFPDIKGGRVVRFFAYIFIVFCLLGVRSFVVDVLNLVLGNRVPSLMVLLFAYIVSFAIHFLCLDKLFRRHSS